MSFAFIMPAVDSPVVEGALGSILVSMDQSSLLRRCTLVVYNITPAQHSYRPTGSDFLGWGSGHWNV